MNPSTLPIYDVKEQIVSALREKNRLILHAPTGSGKSTQVPQFVLDSDIAQGQILVLQPRRIAARMLAARVASERNVKLGEAIGFQTRFESAVSDDTRVLFITEGILPRRLLHDHSLKNVSTIIFDEFHERSLTTDLGLALTRQLQIERRPDLKIIVMSATLEPGPLAAYLENSVTVHTEGRVFPVDIRYSAVGRESPPWDNAVTAVRQLMNTETGDILIFMPGAYEIRRTVEAVRNAHLPELCTLFPLYGDLPPHQQQRVMEPTDRRKIIVATNIAETSLTIPGVRHVVDSGLARINRYDPNRGFNTLYVETISQASAAQRAGRAGREAPGICIRLWSQANHDTRSPRTQPEVARIDLCEALLNVKMMGVNDVSTFPWFEPPPEIALKAGFETLVELGALKADGSVTADGTAMAKLPAHPRLSRLLLESVKRGVPKMGALAAAVLTERQVLTGKPDLPDRSAMREHGSDFNALAYLIDRAEQSHFDITICTRLGLNAGAARQVLRTQAYFLNLLRHQRMHTRDNAEDPHALSKALLLSYPDRLARRRDMGTLQCEFRDGRRGELARESAARGAQFLVATEVREVRNRGQQPKTILTLCCGIEEDWLLELFPDNWRSQTNFSYNAERKAVEQRTKTFCLGVLIEDKLNDQPDPEAAAEFLAHYIVDKNLALNGFDEETQAYIDRIRWVASIFPEQNLPQMGDDDKKLIIKELCAGETRYNAVREKEVLPVIRRILGSKSHFVDSMAPSHIQLPNGRRMPITYTVGQEPKGRSRIQDFYGMNASPKIANGRATVLLEILAPNHRPVQVTNDLAGFWEKHYPELKKTLSRRYPRHEWR